MNIIMPSAHILVYALFVEPPGQKHAPSLVHLIPLELYLQSQQLLACIVFEFTASQEKEKDHREKDKQYHYYEGYHTESLLRN